MFRFLLILVPSLCYGGVALSSLVQGDRPTAVIFTGYLIGNVGFMWQFLAPR